MWQRFTERARQVVFQAQEEASKRSGKYVDSEHLLLGVLHKQDNVAVRILAEMNVSLDALQADIKNSIEPVDPSLTEIEQAVGVVKDMQMSSRAKRIVDLAYDEAKRLKNDYIGTEHILLGIVREAEGTAGVVLAKHKVTLDATRAAVIELQAEFPPSNPSSPSPASSTPPSSSAAALDILRSVVAELQSNVTNTPKEDSTRPTVVPKTPAPAQPVYTALSDSVNIGDLGVVQPTAGRDTVELARTAEAYQTLSDVMLARDAQGYRELLTFAQGSATPLVILLNAGTPIKLLVTPRDTDPQTARLGCYVRILAGDFTGQTGFLRREAFARTGPDESPFPPPVDDAGWITAPR